MELLDHVLAMLIKNDLVINKKTLTRLTSFHTVDDSSDSQNEVNSLTENNHGDLYLDFNENCSLPIAILILFSPTRWLEDLVQLKTN